jgi:WD40 repeat protein/tRNA A-37 threonylcarbamoyl transferase component Bud32
MPPVPGEEVQRQLRQACAELERRLRAGADGGVEGLLQGSPALAADRDAALELLYTEFVLLEELGQRPDPERWFDRFPRWREDLRQLFQVHRAARSTRRETPAHSGAPLRAPDVPGPAGASGALGGHWVGPYEALQEIGRGGMGVVYKARQPGLQRTVALKVLLAGDCAGPAERARFRAEAQAAAHLQHPNIVQIHEVAEHNGLPYFSMELVEGDSVERRLGGAPLPVREAAALAETVARAMHYAHERGILHRDLKPANILLTGDGTAKITDFGLAKRLDGQAGLTQSGAILGTPSYMAPEQAAGRAGAVGPAADVYALGAILYECLTGRPPFRAENALETLLQVQHDDPVPPRRLQPKVPRDLETVCLTCLHKAPGRRYPSAAALADDLGRFLAGKPVTARPIRAWESALKWAKRRPAQALLVGVSGLAILALVGLAVGLAYSTRLERTNSLLGEAIQEAQRQEAEAGRQRARAEDREADARRYLYGSRMSLAQRALEETRLPRLLELLEELRTHRPGQEDLRGFEWYYLWRLAHRDRLTLRGHTGLVFSVAFSPNGKRLASASGDRAQPGQRGEVKVWDTDTGRAVLALPAREVSSLAYSPDGTRLALAGFDRTVSIRDAETGREALLLEGPRVPVLSVAFSPNGQLIATGGLDMTVLVWSAKTGKQLFALRGHNGPVNSLAFSPDSARLASAGDDGALWLWDVTRGKEIVACKTDTGPLLGVAFSPSGQRLASAGADRTVKVWDARAGVNRAPLLTLSGHASSVFAVAFSPNGRRLASAGNDQAVKVWEADTGTEAFTLRGHTAAVRSLAFSADGKQLASAGFDRTIKIWDVAKDPDGITLKGPTHLVTSVAFSPDGRFLAAAGGGEKTGEVIVWEAASSKQLFTLRGHAGRVLGAAFSPDGAWIASASADQTIKVWDTATGKELLTLQGHTKEAQAVAFSPDGRRLASAGAYSNWRSRHEHEEGGEIKVWDARTGLEIRTLRGHVGPIWSVCFSPDGKRLASASGPFIVDNPDEPPGEVKVWDADSGQELLTLKGHTGSVVAVAFSPDGRRLASAGVAKRPPGEVRSGEVKLWDVGSGRELHTLKGHTSSVTGVAFSPDGKRLASSGFHFDLARDVSGGEVKVWDVRTGQELLTLRRRSGHLHGVAFSPDGRRLAAASEAAPGFPGEVKVWEAAPAEP